MLVVLLSWSWMLLVQQSGLAADVLSKLDTREVLIGQPFEVKYSISNQLVKFSPYWDYSSFDDRVDLVVIESNEEEVEGAFLLRMNLVLFDTGSIVIPQIKVISNLINELDTFYSRELEVAVFAPDDFVAELLPIRDILGEPVGKSRNWYWITVVLILLTLALLILFFFHKRKNRLAMEQRIKEVNPNEEALSALHTLGEEGLIEKGEINHYHSELNYIFRRWIERRFEIDALGMTGQELSVHLRSIGVEDEKIRDWTDMLRTIDGIKYARGKPSGDFHENVFVEVKEMVERELERDRQSKEKE